jgi:ABC-type multidrug transport system fused ATPase/permease subunit
MVGSAMFYGLAGIGIMLCLIVCPLASIAKNFKALLKQRDSRVSLQKEFFENIKVLKMYAWDVRFEKRILETRSTELAHLAAINYAGIQIIALMGSFDNVLILSIIISYIGQGNSLTAEVIFPVISLVSFLKIFAQLIPVIAGGLIQVNIGIGRINEYLRKPEVLKSTSSDGSVLYGAGRTDEDAAQIRGGASFEWTPFQKKGKKASTDQPKGKLPKGDTPPDTASAEDSSTRPFSLENIDVTFPRGKITLIVGATGSGKSSLLSALQGDLLPITRAQPEGQAPAPDCDTSEQGPRLGGRVAICTQTAFIQSDTIRNLILFGRPMVQAEYDEALKCCCLVEDLKEMPAGDLTEIGER